jgi:hypothetical protein
MCMQNYLHGLALPFEEEVDHIENSVEASLAAMKGNTAAPVAVTTAAVSARTGNTTPAQPDLHAPAPKGDSLASKPLSTNPKAAVEAEPLVVDLTNDDDAVANAAAAQAALALASIPLCVPSAAAARQPSLNSARKAQGDGKAAAGRGVSANVGGARAVLGNRGSMFGGSAQGTMRAQLQSKRISQGSRHSTGGETQNGSSGGAEPEVPAAAAAAAATAAVASRPSGQRPPDVVAANAAAAVAQAMSSIAALPARPAAPGISVPSIATERKLAKCIYACIASFSSVEVSRAFDAAQQASGIAIKNVQKAKGDLHVTLWHRNSSNRERGRACIAADGEKVTFTISGFDVSDRISAARVCRLDAQQQTPQKVSLDELKMALDVQAPHITLWFAKGVHLATCISCWTALSLRHKPFIWFPCLLYSHLSFIRPSIIRSSRTSGPKVVRSDHGLTISKRVCVSGFSPIRLPERGDGGDRNAR